MKATPEERDDNRIKVLKSSQNLFCGMLNHGEMFKFANVAIITGNIAVERDIAEHLSDDSLSVEEEKVQSIINIALSSKLSPLIMVGAATFYLNQESNDRKNQECLSSR